MRILLVTAGSRGDVEPFAALADRAAAAGHDVVLAAPDRSGVEVERAGRRSLGVDFAGLIEAQGVSVGAALRSYRTVIRPTMRQVIVESARIALEVRPDLIVAHPKILSAPIAAARLGIPWVLVEMVPAMTATRSFPAAGTVVRDLGPLNRATYAAARGAAAMFRADIAEATRLLPAGRVAAPPAATLLPISPALLARPDDWAESVVLTGAWQRPGSAALDGRVADFLADGPVVYAGFGSMAAGDPVRRARAIVEAVRARGERVLVATGWGGLEVPPDLRGDDVLVETSVPHAAVLPHATAAIHHGGAGTVHAALAAGAVSVVVPFIADQPFWGEILRRRGLSPASIPRGRVSMSRVAAALSEAERLRPAVAEVAAQVRREDGTGEALRVLEGLG